MKNFLNFETEIKNLEQELEKLKDPYNQEGLSEVDTVKISELQEDINEIFLMILFLFRGIDFMVRINRLYVDLRNLKANLF